MSADERRGRAGAEGADARGRTGGGEPGNAVRTRAVAEGALRDHCMQTMK